MLDSHHLALFVPGAIVIAFIPGQDVLFVLAQSAKGGGRRGLAAIPVGLPLIWKRWPNYERDSRVIRGTARSALAAAAIRQANSIHLANGKPRFTTYTPSSAHTVSVLLGKSMRMPAPLNASRLASPSTLRASVFENHS
jgi:hypothetical protein